MPDFNSQSLKIFNQEDGDRILKLDSKSLDLKFKVEVGREKDIGVGILYFPGWKAYVDNQPVKTTIIEPSGIFSFLIPPGSHLVSIKFEDTIIRKVGNYLSLITVFILFFFFFRNAKKNN